MKLNCTLIALLFCGLLQAQTSFFVSPSGKDANLGTKEKPFATLTKAKDALRKLGDKKAGSTIYIKGGTYNFTEPFALTEKDGGTSEKPVTYSAFGEEKVVFTGGISIPSDKFKAIKDDATLKRIAPELQGKIVELDLNDFQLNHIKQYPDIFDDDGGIIGFFVNGERMPLSRYPNSGYMTMKKVIINGGGQEAKNEDWANFYAAGGKEKRPPRPGVFEYRDNKTAKWIDQLDRGVWIKGYWRIPWQSECVRIAAIDTVARTITLKAPVPGGIGNKYTRPEGNGKEQYWLLNLLEEIDLPGEWAIDFKDKKLYFYPPKDLKDCQVAIADSKGAIVTMDDASNIVFKGITFEQSLNEGIAMSGGTNNLIAGCTVRNVNKYAIKIDGGTNHTVQSCDLYNLGEGGVWLKGGDENVSPRIPAGHKVINNHIYNFSQIVHIYTPGINAGYTGNGGGGHHTCVGTYVAHNLIHDTPHGGIIYGSWDNVFEYNEIFRMCLVSNDLGAFYSYDHYEKSGNNTFAYNFIHNSNDGDGIYFDHDHYNMHIYGNVLALNSRGGKRGTAFLFKHGSMPKTAYTLDCYNNIAINCGVGFEFVTSESPLNNWKDNVSVNCHVPFEYKYVVADGKEAKQDSSVANGKNMAYITDPGFEDMAHNNFWLKADAQVFKDLPNFKPIPMDKIGLYIDEYRKKLPTDDEIKRFSNGDGVMSLNQAILDRK
jgi:hypothetical protein